MSELITWEVLGDLWSSVVLMAMAHPLAGAITILGLIILTYKISRRLLRSMLFERL